MFRASAVFCASLLIAISSLGLLLVEERACLAMTELDQHYVLIPIPVMFDDAGPITTNGDGSFFASSRFRVHTGEDILWLYDARSNRSVRVDQGGGAALSGDGQFVVYRTWSDFGRVKILRTDTLEEMDEFEWPRYAGVATYDRALRRLSGTRDTRGTSSSTRQVFLTDLTTKETAQLTNIAPPLQVRPGAWISGDGSLVAFVVDVPVSPDRFPVPQVFVVPTNGTAPASQLTGLGGSPIEGCVWPLLSDDARRLVCTSDSVVMIDLDSFAASILVGPEYGPVSAIISGDGNKVAFKSVSDLDLSVGNPDGNPEVFVIDVESREIRQVTDTVFNSVGANVEAISYDGNTIAVSGLAFDRASGICANAARYVLKDVAGNMPPELRINGRTSIILGERARFALSATDPDGEKVVLNAERLQLRPDERLFELLPSLSQSSEDEPGMLWLTPDDPGVFPLRLSAFDFSGGFDVEEVTLRVVCPCDCNEDRQVSVGELISSVQISLGIEDLTRCESSDSNGNQKVEISELLQGVRTALAGGCFPMLGATVSASPSS